MALREKSVLRAAIDSVFGSGRNITAAEARGEYHDWIDSLLAPASVVPGTGITVDQRDDGTVVVAAGGAAAGAGLPSYIATNVVQADDDTITADVDGLSDPPPSPSILYIFMPSVLNRASTDLSISIHGETAKALRDVNGAVAHARDITPGGLYALLRRTSASTSYYLTEILEPRPPDWDLVFAWSTGLLTHAEADDGTVLASASQFTFPDSPPDPAALAWLGVPNDGRPILSLELHGSGVPFVNIYRALADHVAVPQYGGADYTWVSLSGLTAAAHGGNVYDVHYSEEWIT